MKLSLSIFCVTTQLLSSFSDGAYTRNLKSKSSKRSKIERTEGSEGSKGSKIERAKGSKGSKIERAKGSKGSKGSKIERTEDSQIERTEVPKGSKIELPEIGSLMDEAFPMWEVDDSGNRIETKPCTVDLCEWNPFYVTKRYDGLHPDFGGHPTDIDVNYAFYGGSPFGGQPYSGTPHHCTACDGDDIKIKNCPKIETLTDKGPYGPGHIPPHISLASLTWGVEDKLYKLDEMFNYDRYECRVVPDVLLSMIRNYYPRVEGEKVPYPPPIIPEGGDYQYEFPAGNGLDNQEPPYAPGSPHWCTADMKNSQHWDGVCPYVFQGPDAGKYRHPHIAYAALEVYLANQMMPDKCSTTWLENNPNFLDPSRVTTDTPFPTMDADSADAKTVANWIGQPVLPWVYDSGEPKPFPGLVATDVYFADTCA